MPNPPKESHASTEFDPKQNQCIFNAVLRIRSEFDKGSWPSEKRKHVFDRSRALAKQYMEETGKKGFTTADDLLANAYIIDQLLREDNLHLTGVIALADITQGLTDTDFQRWLSVGLTNVADFKAYDANLWDHIDLGPSVAVFLKGSNGYMHVEPFIDEYDWEDMIIKTKENDYRLIAFLPVEKLLSVRIDNLSRPKKNFQIEQKRTKG